MDAVHCSEGLLTQEDPIGLAGGLNLYGYAGGDPVNYSDPFGLFRLEGAAAQQFVRDLQSGHASVEDPRVFNRCEVASILSDYVQRMRSGNFEFAVSLLGPEFAGYPGDLDFKFSEKGSSFAVGGRLLRADEFGNFAAGYAAMTAGGMEGYLSVILGGIVFAMQGRGEPWHDGDSRPMINAGATRALQDRVARPGRPIPLTSRAGCN